LLCGMRIAVIRRGLVELIKSTPSGP
jgi:hypothetical protein